ncbi:hypothetical protein ACWEQ7_01790 [Streptomyces sp. NPDC004069]
MRHLSTDIHGGIEFRHPDVGADYYDGEPWVAAMDLWPLCDETDDAAFGFLFRLNNYAGFQPLAPERGLPLDPSSGVRSQLGPWVAAGDLHSAIGSAGRNSLPWISRPRLSTSSAE